MDYEPNFNVALLPDQRISLESIKLSHLVSNDLSMFTLGEEAVPHISLYMLHLSAEHLQSAVDAVKELARGTDVIKLESPALLHPGGGYHEVAYPITAALVAAQNSAIESLNPLRSPNANKIRNRAAEHAPKQTRLMLKYGYRNVGQLFRPHITLTRFSDFAERDLDLDLSNMSGLSTKIGLFELGPNGTCTKAAALFDLASIDTINL